MATQTRTVDPVRIASVAASSHAAIGKGVLDAPRHRAVRRAAVRALHFDHGWTIGRIVATTGIPLYPVHMAVGAVARERAITPSVAPSNVTVLRAGRARRGGAFQKPIKSTLTQWRDPTFEEAFRAPPWYHERLMLMVEYLVDTYGTEGIVRGEAGRIAATLPRPINHGTRGGYLAHLRRHVPPCRPCLDANTADFLRRRKKASA